MDKIIFHIDINSAFLSWEAVFRLKFIGVKPDLREIPSAVGGDVKLRHGIILAKSIPAKKYGIKTGESIPQARQKCPQLVLVPPNYGLYERCSEAFISLAKEYTPQVEQYSIDEAFLDMTGTKALFGDPVDAASSLKDRIREELGFTVNIGISSNKLLAKMASDFRKPDMVHTLYPEEIQEKMWGLPVPDLFFVGRATAKKLLSLGIRTIGELARTDPALLRQHLKKQGEMIWAFANGLDVSGVQAQQPPNKGYGNSTTMAWDVADRETAHLVLLALAETIGQRLRADDVRVETIAVGIKSFELQYVSRQLTLPEATNLTNEIYRAACLAFDALWDGIPIRHLGIHTSRVQEAGGMHQLDLFGDMRYEKWRQVDRTVDAVRKRNGNDSMKRAVFIGSPIDHMSGGVSREKRSVDYHKEYGWQ